MKQVKLIKSYQSNELEEKINIAIQENGLANIHDIKINMAIDEDNDAVYLATIIYEEDKNTIPIRDGNTRGNPNQVVI